jgi:hypothetical protein
MVREITPLLVRYFNWSYTEILIKFNYIFIYVNMLIKGKGKPIQLQAWTGPEDYRRLSLPDFKTIST